MPTGNAIGNTNRSIAPATTTNLPVETSSNNSIAVVSGQKADAIAGSARSTHGAHAGFFKVSGYKGHGTDLFVFAQHNPLRASARQDLV